jgi:hypothetical protein
MVSEELTGKDLKALAKEYISTLGGLEIVYDTRESSLFDLMVPQLKKSIVEVEKDADKLKLRIPNGK